MPSHWKWTERRIVLLREVSLTSRLACTSKKIIHTDTNTNFRTYLPLTPILTFALTLTLLAHMRVRGQESGVKRQVQLFDQMSDQEDISLVRVTD